MLVNETGKNVRLNFDKNTKNMNTEHFEIRSMADTDWEDVAEIYKQGIDTGNATFEQKIPAWTAWDNAHLKKCRLIATINNEVAGWAALSPISGRCIYAGVAEVSVYVSKKHRGRRVGTKLLEKLIKKSEKEQFWTLQAGIFPENTASLSIHAKVGFRQVGYREKIGKLNDVWRDNVFLERRSSVVGRD
jgi:L-amino acid N-acyltransferase YncA